MDQRRFFFLILTVTLAWAASLTVGDINCVEDSCADIVCPQSNCTFGKLMSSPSSPCDCCKYCLEYIDENEACGTNWDKICGPGLNCSATPDGYRCVKLDTDCVKAQQKYDDDKLEGSVGIYVARPQCDASGDFAAKKCQPGSSCYCVSKENKRIFGEAPPNNAADMTCECSRDYENALTLGFRALQFPHCLPNGNYDALQCINQACYCIDDKQDLASQMVPITAIEDLPCYDKEIHFKNYYRPCELEKIQIEQLRSSYTRQNITVLGLELPDCSPDGFFKPVRKTETTKYCVDPFGKKIEEFEVPNSSTSMDCACARTRYLLSGQNVARPQCSSNGNYKPIQCRGGVCFCVDLNGDQCGLEVQSTLADSLKCDQPNLNC